MSVIKLKQEVEGLKKLLLNLKSEVEAQAELLDNLIQEKKRGPGRPRKDDQGRTPRISQ